MQITLTSQQLEILWENTPTEGWAEITFKNNNGISAIKAEIKDSSDASQEILYLDPDGTELPEEEYDKLK